MGKAKMDEEKKNLMEREICDEPDQECLARYWNTKRKKRRADIKS
jgi:hypothetical protein